MCINANTSIASFLIGEICGLILLTKSKDKQILGLFVMFYTLVQLFEYNIYNGNSAELNSRLLLLNLGFQGLVFFVLVNQICDVNKIYLIITGLITLFILYKSLLSDFNSATLNTCLKWNFIDKEISLLLTIMYGAIFYWLFSDKICIENYSKFFDIASYYFGGTAILSFILSQRENSPSFWCMSSAILAPLLLLN